ncbi:MAG: rhomboid family intramembrane serine protease [Acidiferrobacterales bacterium]|nr:rhomboid family intramembrane serine protease [Acidiferrobacterales bacterium]
MIPYKDENPTHHLPIVTFAIIGLNVISWLILQGLGEPAALAQSVCQFGAIPGSLVGSISYDTSAELICPPTNQSWITVFTSMFMHGGWFHLIGNMWFLWIFADNIEDALRPLKFIIFYLVGGVAAVAAQVISNPESMVPMVGASGAIGGIMGAYARLYPKVRVHIAIILGFFILRRTIPAIWMLGIWLGMQGVSAFMSMQSGQQGGVAFWAHIGGFVAGFILIPFFNNSERSAPREI